MPAESQNQFEICDIANLKDNDMVWLFDLTTQDYVCCYVKRILFRNESKSALKSTRVDVVNIGSGEERSVWANLVFVLKK
jgi:hypothetical protein